VRQDYSTPKHDLSIKISVSAGPVSIALRIGSIKDRMADYLLIQVTQRSSLENRKNEMMSGFRAILF